MLSLLNTVVYYVWQIASESGVELSLLKYKVYAWATMSIMLVILLALYLFVSIGIAKIAKRERADKAWLAWIPVAQLVLLIKVSNSEKICWMKKKTFTIVFLSVALFSLVFSIVAEVFEYSGTTLKLLFLKKDAWNIEDYILYSDEQGVLLYFSEILSSVTNVLTYFIAFDFLRQRTGKYWILTLLCIFFHELFPIFVFAFRNAPKVNYAIRRWGYYTSVPPRQEKPRSSNPEKSPFEEFNDVSPKDAPFSEFNSSSNSSDSNGGELSSDDMFN